MVKLHRLLIVLALLSIGSSGLHAQTKVLFDTDFGGDADDLGALVMLHHFMEHGECELLGIMCWSTEKYAVPAIDAINRYYGHPGIPIGHRREGSHRAEWNYTKPLADKFTHALDQEQARDATGLYREILARSEDTSIVLVTVGPLKNLENLLRSEPDQFAALPGKILLEKKVKEVVIMGGKFPEGTDEWNFNGNMPGVTSYVLSHLQVPVVFSGFEVGAAIKTGKVFNQLDANHPLYVGFKHFSANAPWMNSHYQGEILDNSSFDQTAVLYAVRKGVGTWWELSESGFCIADDHGGNRWESTPEGYHNYLKLKADPEELAGVIESIMLNRPATFSKK
jgi:inosine-uridine nucleoside N-ribohydrolase